MKTLLIGLALLFSQSALAEYREGKFYPVGGPAEGKPLFVQKIERGNNAKGQRTHKSTIEDAEGKVVMTETALLDGWKVISQRVDQLQILESYELETKNDQLIFRTFKLSGEKGEKRELVSEKTVAREGDFITGPATEPFLKDKFSGQGEGKTVSVEFGIFEVEKPITFEFKHRGVAKDGAIKASLKPSSFWVSFIVEPIYLELDAKTFALTKYKGRTPVRQKLHGSWKPIDALIIYEDVKKP